MGWVGERNNSFESARIYISGDLNLDPVMFARSGGTVLEINPHLISAIKMLSR